MEIFGFKEVMMGEWGNAIMFAITGSFIVFALGFMTYLGNRKRDPKDSEKDN